MSRRGPGPVPVSQALNETMVIRRLPGRDRLNRPLRSTIVVVGLVVLLAACGGLPPGAPGLAAAENGPQFDQRVADPVKTESIAGRYLAGRYARYLGDNAAAADFYRKALAADPSNDALKRRTFRLLVAAGYLDDAVKLAATIKEDESDEGLPSTMLVLADIKAGRAAQADATLDKLVPTGFNTLLKPVMEAWAKAGQKKYDEAIKELGALGANPRFRPFQGFHEALIFDLAGKMGEAETAYRQGVENPQTRSLRGVQAFVSFLARNNRVAEAQALFDQYLAEENDNPLVVEARAALNGPGKVPPLVGDAAGGIAEAFYGAGRSLLQGGSREMATVYTQLALYLKPDFDIAQTFLGQIYESDERWQDAIDTYRKVKPQTPLGWASRLQVARNLSRLEKNGEAIALLNTMAAEKPERTDALIFLGDTHRADEKWLEAIAAYDLAVQRTPAPDGRDWTLFYSRGIANERAKRWSQAEADFLKALELQPNQPLVLNYLGYSWIEQNLNLPKARGMIEKAVELRPRDGYIVDSLGWVLYQLGEFQGAVDNLERAIGLRPDDPVINDHLGDAYWKVGRRNEARFQWNRALTFKPDAELIPAIERKLRDGL